MKAMIPSVVTGLLLALPAVGWSVSDGGGRAAAAVGGDSFLQEAAAGGLAEVELGKLAQQKATLPDVKAFARRMTDEHGKANEELKLLAAQKDVTLPHEIDAEHKALYYRLAALSGPAFDKAYVDQMVKGHREVVAEFQKASQSGDPEVEAFAARTLPTLQLHLQIAQQLAASSALKTP